MDMASLGGLAARYVDARQGRGEFAPRTAATVYSVLISLAESVGYKEPPTKLTQAKIERWLSSRRCGDATKRRSLSHIRNWCRWMLTHGYIRRDPTNDIRGPREPRRLPRALKRVQVAAMLDACDDVREEAMVVLMVQEGLRCVEVSRLQVGDIDWFAGIIHVVGKGSHEREVPITEQCRDSLERYLRKHPAGSGPLLRSYADDSRGISAGYISTIVSRVARRAGVHVLNYDGNTAHALRHTAATDVVDNGGDIRDVQAFLGHENLSTSSIYIKRKQAAHLREVIDGRWYGLRHGELRGRELGGEYGQDRGDAAGESAELGLHAEPGAQVDDLVVNLELPRADFDRLSGDVMPSVE